jgi:hypothetical protein
MIEARQLLSLGLNPLLRLRALRPWMLGRALLSLWTERVTCSGGAQQVWKNAGLPWFNLLGGSGLLRCNRLGLWAVWHDPGPSRALGRIGCGVGQPAKNRMGFAQGCFLSRTANLDSLLSVSQEKVLEQRFCSGRISDYGNRLSDADSFATGLDLDRERPRLASHERFAMVIGGRKLAGFGREHDPT